VLPFLTAQFWPEQQLWLLFWIPELGGSGCQNWPVLAARTGLNLGLFWQPELAVSGCSSGSQILLGLAELCRYFCTVLPDFGHILVVWGDMGTHGLIV